MDAETDLERQTINPMANPNTGTPIQKWYGFTLIYAKWLIQNIPAWMNKIFVSFNPFLRRYPHMNPLKKNSSGMADLVTSELKAKMVIEISWETGWDSIILVITIVIKGRYEM